MSENQHNLKVGYTDASRKAMQLAYQEAQRCGRELIDAGDILIGLLKMGNSVAHAVLEKHGVTLREIRDAMEASDGVVVECPKWEFVITYKQYRPVIDDPIPVVVMKDERPAQAMEELT